MTILSVFCIKMKIKRISFLWFFMDVKYKPGLNFTRREGREFMFIYLKLHERLLMSVEYMIIQKTHLEIKEKFN